MNHIHLLKPTQQLFKTELTMNCFYACLRKWNSYISIQKFRNYMKFNAVDSTNSIITFKNLFV